MHNLLRNTFRSHGFVFNLELSGSEVGAKTWQSLSDKRTLH